MRRISITFLLIIGFNFPNSAAVTAQTSARKIRHCQFHDVYDSERHGFDELKPIRIDVDGDGHLDTITPHVWRTGKTKVQHWISFDVRRARGGSKSSFFKYMYGGADTYWVWALVPCKADGDRLPDLLFYTGDDTSQESVILKNTGSSFRVLKRRGGPLT